MPSQIINDVLLDNISLATTTTSSVVDLSFYYVYSVQITVAGAGISGSVQVQGSNSIPVNGVVSNWVSVGSAVTLSAAGTQFVEKDACGFKWLRVVYTTAAGTGTLTVTLCAKG